MSLTDWVEWDKDVFKWFNKPKLNISGDLLAPPLTTHYSTVGTAFDYALRFLISKTYRIYDNNDKWVAHHSIGNNKQRKDFIKTVEHKFNEYLYSNQLSISDFYSDFIIMARLDAIFRSGQERPNIEIFNVPPDTIKELQTLINITDINLFKFEHQCLLNPTFGKSSQDIGGADADLVIDDTLIDIKTTKHLEFTAEQFRQLMGYYILNLRANNPCGEIKYLGIYYSRFGKMFKFSPLVEDSELFAPIDELKSLSYVTSDDINNFKEWRTSMWANIEESINEYKEA